MTGVYKNVCISRQEIISSHTIRHLICDALLQNRQSEILFGIYIDNKLSFNELISKLCKKVNKNFIVYHVSQNKKEKKKTESL